MLVDADFLVSQKLAKEKLARKVDDMESAAPINPRHIAAAIRQADLTDCRVEITGNFDRIQMGAILRDYRHASEHSLGAAEQGRADAECLAKLATLFHGEIVLRLIPAIDAAKEGK